MRALLSIVAGVALAVGGTLAIAGSAYTPPASSGGGVGGDGTGVTDASAFRSALSLGTAATANTGTSMGNVVALGAGAALPAVNASNLTGISSTQVSGLGTAAGYSATSFLQSVNNLSDVTPITARSNLGLGTAATLDTGTGAGNVVVLDGSAKLPAVDGSALTGLTSSQMSGLAYAAESWTDRWRTADGDPTSNGWTQAGTQNMTIASTTQGGVSCYSLTPSGSSGTSYIQKTWTAATGSYELYFKVWLPASTLGAYTQRMSISYSPDATASGSKRIELGLGTTGFGLFDGTNLTSRATIPDTTAQWVDILIQATQATNGAANTWLRIYIGRVLIYNALAPTLGGTAGAGAGTVYIGRINTGTQTGVFYIADMALKTSWNEAPAEYRFRSSAWPL